MERRYSDDSGYSVDAYFDLVRQGVLDERDRVELLDGVIVAEPPMDPPHATGITMVAEALRSAVGTRALIRIQSPFIAGLHTLRRSRMSQSSRAVRQTILDHHPSSALLVVEVSAIVAQTGPLVEIAHLRRGRGDVEYWILSLICATTASRCSTHAARRVYGARAIGQHGDHLLTCGAARGERRRRRSPAAAALTAPLHSR